MPKDVREFEYPSKVTKSGVVKGLWQTSKLDTLFHSLMAVLLITGLIIDLLGTVLGGSLTPVRQVLHGYIGTLFVIVFPIYLIKILATRKTRMLMTAINYVDFLLYFILIITGITIASANQVWVDTLPGLSSALSGLAPTAPSIHTITTYLWLVVSIVFPGGFLHGIATVYLVEADKESEER